VRAGAPEDEEEFIAGEPRDRAGVFAAQADAFARANAEEKVGLLRSE